MINVQYFIGIAVKWILNKITIRSRLLPVHVPFAGHWAHTQRCRDAEKEETGLLFHTH